MLGIITKTVQTVSVYFVCDIWWHGINNDGNVVSKTFTCTKGSRDISRNECIVSRVVTMDVNVTNNLNKIGNRREPYFSCPYNKISSC